jgi:TPR repeat protein
MADYSQTTRLFVGRDLLQAPPGDKFLRAVQRAVAGDFEVLGELGRGAKGKIVYLARETASRGLVALQLLPGDGGVEAGELWLDVLRKLDASVPSADGKCPRCGQALRGWGRFCSQCGSDLSGIAPGSGADTSVDRLLDAVKQAAGSKYEVLGQMDRSEGGGVVYFAREKEGGKIVALRLQKDAPAADGRERYNLGQTMMLNSVVNSLLGPEDKPAPAPEPVVSLGEKAPPKPPPSTVTPTPRPESGRVLVYGFGALALLLLVGLVLWSGRGRPASTAAVADTVPEAPPVEAIDSAELQIGGTLPKRAVVTVDGEEVDPAATRLAPGTYRIRVAAPGYKAVEQDMELKPGQTMVWTPQLARATASAPRPAPPPARPAPTPTTRPAPAPVDTSPLVINQRPAPAPRESLPGGPMATGGAPCASLFSALEWSRALAACEREAGQGGTAAQRTLGTMYERGLATEASPAEAARWYAKAAEAGDRIAQYRLGVLLRNGKGVKRDEKAAVKWFQRSADQGEADAMLALAQAYDRGQGVKRSRTTAAGWYLKAAEQGKAEAQFRLGEFHEKGEAGLVKSEVEATKWFKLAAAQGHQEAQKKLSN